MSNLIKWNHFNIQAAEGRRVIDSNQKAEECLKKYRRPVAVGGFVPINLAEGADFIADVPYEPDSDAEQAVETELDTEREQWRLQMAQMMEDTAREADRLKAESAKKGYEEGFAKGQKEGYQRGYEEGHQNGMAAAKEIEDSLNQQIRYNQSMYEEQVAALEPEFAALVIRYVERLTGIAASGYKDILGYLLHNAIYHAEPSKYYIVHVPAEQFNLILEQRDRLAALVSAHADFDIVSDSALKENECTIETDSCMIDAGLGVQLQKLTAGLKLIIDRQD